MQKDHKLNLVNLLQETTTDQGEQDRKGQIVINVNGTGNRIGSIIVCNGNLENNDREDNRNPKCPASTRINPKKIKINGNK